MVVTFGGGLLLRKVAKDLDYQLIKPERWMLNPWKPEHMCYVQVSIEDARAFEDLLIENQAHYEQINP